MRLPTIQEIEKLIEADPRKKDREFWEIGRQDINSHNRNMWECWLRMKIHYLQERAERSGKVKNSVSVNLEKSDSVQA